MTELTITPKIADKTARFKGAVAAGEHVAVTIKGGAAWLGDDNGEHLSLRVLDLVTGRTLAVFPRPEDTLDEGDEPDEWSTSAEDPNDLFCNLNLNTDRMVNAARHMLRVPVLFVMGAKDEENPATTRTLYFRDRHEVEFWPERVGDDTPYDLDRWPKQIDEWTELVTDWNRRMNAMKLSAERVERTESSVGKVTITLNDGNAETDTVVDVFDGADGEVTPAQLNAAIADVNNSIGDVASDLATHANNGDIHVTATQKAAWTAKYDKPSGGVPKSDLSAAVQSSLGKADTALQEHQSLAAYVNAAVYDSNAKKILLKHDGATVAEIDATAFIKDGMVDGVEVSGGNLVISFNTDAGTEDIEIPLTDIFNPANYYDKTAADGRFVQKETGKGLFSGSYNDLEDKPAIPAAQVNADWNAAGGVARILNKPTLAPVATSGSYNDLSNKPTIPPAVTVDDTVTRTSTNPVKSSGIWGAIWGALSALPSGFASLYDWCVAQLAGKRSLDDFAVNGWRMTKPDGTDEILTYDAEVGIWFSGNFDLSYSSGLWLLSSATVDITTSAPESATSLTFTDGSDTYSLVRASRIALDADIAGKQDALSAQQLANIAAVPGKADAADLRYRIAEAEYSASVGTAGGYLLADRAVNSITATDETSIDIELPAAVTVDGVRYCRDFILDVDNSANASDLALEFTGLGVSYAFVPLEDDSISEMMTIGGGERVRLYFTETPYTATGSLPVINVARVTLGDFVTSTATQGGN